MTAVHMLGDRLRVPAGVVFGLRKTIYNWRGRPLLDPFEGREFIYIGMSSDWPGCFEVDVWSGQEFIRISVNDDEIFHDLRSGRELHERTAR